ncbi:MAG: translational GTPase TypA, partial [Clostridiaceae bacterium]|nr:translational GTPase TypA [Clostridiaceae bacterium]
QMRREGYELAVSKPEVILKENDQGKKTEPVEEVIIEIPDEYAGAIIAELNIRKGMMASMNTRNGRSKLVYTVPTRGLLGLRTIFMNMTRGEGTMVRRFYAYESYKGEIAGRSNGAIVAQEEGMTTAYALANIAERAELFLEPGTHVYEGMIVGLNSRNEDMVVNPCKAKRVSNMRAAGSDEAIKLPPHRLFTLEEALEFINDDELVEITPQNIRLRKRLLSERERRKAGNNS